MKQTLRIAISLSAWSILSYAVAQSAPPNVVRLRADDVMLTPIKGGAARTVHREDLKAPWPIKDHTAAGDPVVEYDGKRYAVAAIDVVTDELRTGRPCIDSTAPKPGATRGFDACKK